MVRLKYLPRIFALCWLCVGSIPTSFSQTSAVRSPRTSQSGIYLVFPFENAGASLRLDWLGEGLEELTIQRLGAAGEQVYSHAGRLNELEQYGLPSGAKLSRATMLRIGEDLDADFIVFGKFASNGETLSVDARVMRVSPTSLLPTITESGPLNSLMDLQQKLSWRMLTSNDNSYPLSFAEFTKLQRPLRLDAFEHYIRGLLANEDDGKLRELKEAARLEPEWPEPAFALAEVYFVRRDCGSALQWYGRVPKTHERYAETVFSSGVCRLLLNQPDKAEELFSGLQNSLRNNMISGADLPEILNNLAIARARQDKLALAQADLRRAADIDPDDGDYPFNSGMLALRNTEFADAVKHFREAVARDPENSEDRALLIFALEKAGNKVEADQEREAAKETFGPTGLPAVHAEGKSDILTKLDRIKPELDTTMLRLEVKTAPEASAMGSTPSAGDAVAAHLRRGRQELSAGNAAEAEKEFRAALASDATNAAALRGLGESYRSEGKLDDAAKELQASLRMRDSAAVRVTLAHIYLEQKKTDLARAQVDLALKLAPNYSDAKKLRDFLQNSQGAGKKPAGAGR